MKLCAICRSSDILCSGCSRKLESGSISEADVALSRSLARLVKPPANYIKAVSHRGKLVILCEKKDARLIIGPRGKNAKSLSEALGADIRVIERAEERKTIENILGAPVVGINVVYGSSETKRVRIDAAYRRLRGDAELLGKMLGGRYELVFE